MDWKVFPHPHVTTQKQHRKSLINIAGFTFALLLIYLNSFFRFHQSLKFPATVEASRKYSAIRVTGS